jgi:hypothetical protein
LIIAGTRSHDNIKAVDAHLGLTSCPGATPKFVSATSISTGLIPIAEGEELYRILYVAPIAENKGPNRGNSQLCPSPK